MILLREVVSDNSKHILVDESAFPSEEEVVSLFEAKEEANEKQEKESKRLRHLHHAEDMIVVGGHHGFRHVMGALQKTHDHLLGKPREGYSIKTKFDGSPSVVWGHDPQNSKFFVGTKSFHNKVPKINHTDADVDTNHGHAPALAERLKFLLKSLKKSTPSKGIFQGDLMYTAADIGHKDGKLSFTPNTLTYNVDKFSHEGQKIMKSKVGIAPHTHYEQEPNGDLKAVYDVNMNEFKPDDDVHYLPTTVRGPHQYKSKDISEFMKHYKEAQGHQENLRKTDGFKHIDGHQQLLMSYINSAVKARKEPSADGYISWLYGEFKKKSDKLKLEKNKVAMRKQLDGEVEKIIGNKKHLNTILKAHKSVQNAKNVLVNSLSKSSPYNETILGEKSKPEGYVVTIDGKPMKLVDRNHFSAANFDWNAKANPEDNPTVMSWGRMNPPHAGHEKMIKFGQDIARRTGADHKVVASRTSGDKDNPLTPQQKLQWLKTMFPGTNTTIAGDDKTTLIAQLQHLHNTGVSDLTMVAGDDKIKHFQDILAKYNGEGLGKLFNFKKARVISAGARDENSKGTEGMSATKMRKAAREMDMKTFKSGLPKHIKDKEADKMFHDLRVQLGITDIGSTTSSHSLSAYADRDDKIGKKAKDEIARRKRKGQWSDQGSHK